MINSRYIGSAIISWKSTILMGIRRSDFLTKRRNTFIRKVRNWHFLRTMWSRC